MSITPFVEKTEPPAAVAATDPLRHSPLTPRRDSSLNPTSPGDAAVGRGNTFPGEPFPGIAPHRGWTLHAWDGLTGDGATAPSHVAHGPDDYVVLQTSRFRFTPTQARFAWLIDNAVLGNRRSGPGPWNDARIDAGISFEARLAA